MLLMHKEILLVTNEMKSTALTEPWSFAFCNQIAPTARRSSAKDCASSKEQIPLNFLYSIL